MFTNSVFLKNVVRSSSGTRNIFDSVTSYSGLFDSGPSALISQSANLATLASSNEIKNLAMSLVKSKCVSGLNRDVDGRNPLSNIMGRISPRGRSTFDLTRASSVLSTVDIDLKNNAGTLARTATLQSIASAASYSSSESLRAVYSLIQRATVETNGTRKAALLSAASMTSKNYLEKSVVYKELVPLASTGIINGNLSTVLTGNDYTMSQSLFGNTYNGNVSAFPANYLDSQTLSIYSSEGILAPSLPPSVTIPTLALMYPSTDLPTGEYSDINGSLQELNTQYDNEYEYNKNYLYNSAAGSNVNFSASGTPTYSSSYKSPGIKILDGDLYSLNQEVEKNGYSQAFNLNQPSNYNNQAAVNKVIDSLPKPEKSGFSIIPETFSAIGSSVLSIAKGTLKFLSIICSIFRGLIVSLAELASAIISGTFGLIGKAVDWIGDALSKLGDIVFCQCNGFGAAFKYIGEALRAAYNLFLRLLSLADFSGSRLTDGFSSLLPKDFCPAPVKLGC